MGAEYLSYVKSIASFAPTFYGYIISVLASVHYLINLRFALSYILTEYTSQSERICCITDQKLLFPSKEGLVSRVRPRIFDQVGH